MTTQTPNAPALPVVGFTPGPWSYRPMKHDDWGIVRAPNEPGQFAGGIICQAYDPDARDELTLAKHREAGTDPWEANARLIAAAPALYEALEKAEAALQAMMDAWFDYHDAHSLTQPVTGAAGNAFGKALEARDDARAALARTGEAK